MASGGILGRRLGGRAGTLPPYLLRLVAISLLAVSCGDEDPTGPNSKPPTPASPTVTIVPRLTGIPRGDSLQLTAVVRNPAGDSVDASSIVWTSSNPLAVRVDSRGMVYGIGDGPAGRHLRREFQYTVAGAVGHNRQHQRPAGGFDPQYRGTIAGQRARSGDRGWVVRTG
jgi:hypothetical protein